MNMDIEENIKRIREEKRLSQAEMARRLNIDPSAYFRLEKRGEKLTYEQIENFAKALNVEVINIIFEPEALSNQIVDTDKDREIEELKKRVEELEDRLKDKEKINLVLEEKIQEQSNALAQIIYDYTLNYAIEAKAPLLSITETEKDSDLIPLFLEYKSRNIYLGHNHNDPILQEWTDLFKNIPFTKPKYHIKEKYLKDVISYCFSKNFEPTIGIYTRCLKHVKDEKFVDTWDGIGQMILQIVDRQKDVLEKLKNS